MHLGKIDNLKKWLFENNCIVTRKNDKRVLTHLLLDGGKLHVPFKLYDKFLEIYSLDIRNSCNHYISENRSEFFRLFIDIDYLSKIKLNFNEILNIVINIQKSLIQTDIIKNNAFENKIIVCTTETKNINKNNKQLIKNGIHIHFPNIIVNSEQALIIRSIIIQYFSNFYETDNMCDTLENIFDYSVYKSSGLRMLGSRKCIRCKICKSKKKLVYNCQNCYATGKIDEGRVYKPLFVLGKNGKLLEKELKILNNDILYAVKQTILRLDKKESNININISLIDKYFSNNKLPKWFKYDILLKHITQKKIRNKKVIKNLKKYLEKNNKITNKLQIRKNDKRFRELNIFLKSLKNINNNYKNIEIVALFCVGEKKNHI